MMGIYKENGVVLMEYIVLMSKGGEEKEEGKKIWYWVGINIYRIVKLFYLDLFINNKFYVLIVDWSYI